MGSGDDLQEVQAGLLQQRAVLGVEEAQAILVDDLDLHAFPFLPAPGADRREHLLLDRGTEGDTVGGRGLAFLSAARARDRHFFLRQTHHYILTRCDLRGGPGGRDNGGSWKSRSRTEASPPSTSRPRPRPSGSPSSSGSTRLVTWYRRWSSLPPGSWPCRWPGSWRRSAAAKGSRS